MEFVADHPLRIVMVLRGVVLIVAERLAAGPRTWALP
jgi:hypothetical protein